MNTADIHSLMPLIILTAGSVLCLLAGAWKRGGYLYLFAAVATAAALTWSLAVPQEATLPGLTISRFSRMTSAFLYACGMLALLLSWHGNRRRGIEGEEFPATLLFALTGMGATCAASDLLMLFLGLEAFTFALYILVAIEPDSERGGEAGLKYLLNGTLSAATMAMGMALLYVAGGTLKFSALAATLSITDPLTLAGLGMTLLGLAFKLSLVPAHLWTPDVYQGAPAQVTALLSTASKAAAVVALLLLLPLLSPWHGFRDIMWSLALLSLLAGNLAALLQTSLKRMLAWSSIAQMGYVALAFTAHTTGGARAALFYVIVYALAGLAAFAVLTVLSAEQERDDLAEWRGIGYSSPLAGFTLATAMFSLAGIPPTAGFMAKLAVFSAALRGGEVALALTGILSALISVYFYLRVVVLLYMKSERADSPSPRRLLPADLPALVVPLAALLFLGIQPSPLLDIIAAILP